MVLNIQPESPLRREFIFQVATQVPGASYSYVIEEVKGVGPDVTVMGSYVEAEEIQITVILEFQTVHGPKKVVNTELVIY